MFSAVFWAVIISCSSINLQNAILSDNPVFAIISLTEKKAYFKKGKSAIELFKGKAIQSQRLAGGNFRFLEEAFHAKALTLSASFQNLFCFSNSPKTAPSVIPG